VGGAGSDPTTLEFLLMITFPVLSSILAIFLMGIVVRLMLGRVQPDLTKLEQLNREAELEGRMPSYSVDMTGRIHAVPTYDFEARLRASKEEGFGVPEPVDPGSVRRAEALALEAARVRERSSRE
jgi:hypothetical protein